MSSASFTTLTTSANTIIGSSSSNSHQVNRQLSVYNNLNLNNGYLTQTGSNTNTLSAPTVFNSSVTLNGGITNNNLQLCQWNMSYGYRANIPTAGFLQLDLAGTQTVFFWDNVELGVNLIVDGNSTLYATTTILNCIINGYLNLYAGLNLMNASLSNANMINFNNVHSMQHVDSAGQNYLRLGRSGFNDLKIDSTGVSVLNNLYVGGSMTFTNVINNGYCNVYGGLNLMNSALQSINKISFNNGTGNGFYMAHVDDSGLNKYVVGRVAAGVGYFDLSVGGSDGTVTVGYNAIINGSATINNDLTLNSSLVIPSNGVWSLYFGNKTNNIISRYFSNSTGAFIDFYNTLTYRYCAAKDNVTLINKLTITSTGITVTGDVNCSNYVYASLVQSAGYILNYLSVPSYYTSNKSVIGSNQIFYPLTNIDLPSTGGSNFIMQGYPVLQLGIGSTYIAGSQLQHGIYSLKCDWRFINGNSSNTVSMQWAGFGCSSSPSLFNYDNTFFNEYKQEQRTIPTNSLLQSSLAYAVHFSTSHVLNTAIDFPSNTIYFSAHACYIGGTGLYMWNTGVAATKFTFTRIA